MELTKTVHHIQGFLFIPIDYETVYTPIPHDEPYEVGEMEIHFALMDEAIWGESIFDQGISGNGSVRFYYIDPDTEEQELTYEFDYVVRGALYSWGPNLQNDEDYHDYGEYVMVVDFDDFEHPDHVGVKSNYTVEVSFTNELPQAPLDQIYASSEFEQQTINRYE